MMYIVCGILTMMTIQSFASSCQVIYKPKPGAPKYLPRPRNCDLTSGDSKFDWNDYEEIGTVELVPDRGVEREEFFRLARSKVCRKGGDILWLEGWYNHTRGIVLKKKTIKALDHN